MGAPRVAPLVAFAVVAAALTVGVLSLARAQVAEPEESEMIDFSEQRYYEPGIVQQAFGSHGIDLPVRSRSNGLLVLSDDPLLRAGSLQVAVAPRTGTGSWGPELDAYDERFGNLLVTYDGQDEQLLADVKAAVADLRGAR
jgi:hypothetical protein